MHQDYEWAFVELTGEEAERFAHEDEFQQVVLRAAHEVSEATDRTVIIADRVSEIGLYHTDTGYEPTAGGAQLTLRRI